MAAALHAGHAIRPELQRLLALAALERVLARALPALHEELARL